MSDGGRTSAIVWGIVGGDDVGGSGATQKRPKVRARGRGRALWESRWQGLTLYKITNVTVQGPPRELAI